VSSLSRADFKGTTRFQVLRRIGAGGMGVVYEALDRERNCRVALKTVRDVEGEELLRLKNEFRALQDLNHPNLVDLGELLEDSGRWFFTMELIDGVSFLDYVRVVARDEPPAGDEAPPPDDPTQEDVSASAATWKASSSSQSREIAHTPARCFDEPRLRSSFRQLAEALAVVHAAGKVHRDIKPSNVLVTQEGRAVLLDFGLATGTLVSDLSTAGHAVGTVAYMAPEQATSQRVGPAADWYSVGALLYEALTGQMPFVGAPLEILLKKLQSDPPRPTTVCPGIPADLDTLAAELLRFDPTARPSGAEILARLGGAAQPEQAGHSSAPSYSQTPPFIGRQHELETLRAAFATSRQGQAVAVLVEGESGIGKSALVRRFTAELEDGEVVVLSGHCYEREALPFKTMDGVIDALGRYLVRLPATEAAVLLPREVGLLAQVFPVLRRVEAAAEAPVPQVADPQEQRSRMFRAMRELLGSLADRRPLVVTIDDLQWADADGLAMLAELLRPPDPPPMLLVATLRSNVGVAADMKRALPTAVRRIELGKLALAEAHELAERLLDRAVGGPGGNAAAIAAEASGHPLFIDELVRHVAAHGAEGARSLHLDEALRARITELPSQARLVLELLAVAGAPLSQGVVAKASAVIGNDFTRCTGILRAASLVQGTGSRSSDTLAPYHDRVRVAVVAGLSNEQRRAHHRRLALALEGADRVEPEVLATHWRDAGDGQRAAMHFERAAAAAETALAFDHAARLYAAAIELRGESHDSTRSLRINLGNALANAGRGQQAAEAYLRAVAGGTRVEALELRRRAAEQLLRSGHVEEGLDAIRTVLRSIGLKLAPTPRRALVSVLLLRARVRLRGLRFKLREASEVPQGVLARIDIYRAVATGLALVDAIRAAEFNARALLLALRAGEPTRLAVALGHEAGFVSIRGERTAARTARLVRLTRSLSQTHTAPLLRGWAAASGGLADYYSGRFKSARTEFEQAIEHFRAARSEGVAFEIDAIQIWLLLILFFLGELAEMRVRLLRLVAEAEDHGDLFAATNLRLSWLNLAWLLDDDAAAARRVAQSASKAWSQTDFDVQHWYDLTAQTNLDIHEGNFAGAYGRVCAAWPGLKGSMLLRCQMVCIEAWQLRARAALALAQIDSDQRQRLLREAEQDAHRIQGEQIPCAGPFAELILASAASLRGEDSRAVAHAAAAVTGFEAADMALYAAVARRRHGQLLGRDEGRALVEAADAWMRGQRIANPAHWTAMLAPGFRDWTSRVC
jgi:eukaryotic-like serine/threonine-protein kinase